LTASPCGQLFSSLFFFDFHQTNFFEFRRTFHRFDPVGFAIFATHARALEGALRATAISFVAPLITVALAALMLKERVRIYVQSAQPSFSRYARRARSIIESHGGRIWASRNSGPGATFHFTLPVAAETGSC
jgi:hypothetical protein